MIKKLFLFTALRVSEEDEYEGLYANQSVFFSPNKLLYMSEKEINCYANGTNRSGKNGLGDRAIQELKYRYY